MFGGVYSSSSGVLKLFLVGTSWLPNELLPLCSSGKSQTVNDHEVLDVDFGDIGDFIFGWFIKEVVKKNII